MPPRELSAPAASVVATKAPLTARVRAHGRRGIAGYRHHDCKARNCRPRCISARSEWRKCAAPDRQSNSRSVSVACIRTDLRVAIPIVGKRLRIPCTGPPVLSKSGPRTLCEPVVLLVAVAHLTIEPQGRDAFARDSLRREAPHRMIPIGRLIPGTDPASSERGDEQRPAAAIALRSSVRGPRDRAMPPPTSRAVPCPRSMTNDGPVELCRRHCACNHLLCS